MAVIPDSFYPFPPSASTDTTSFRCRSETFVSTLESPSTMTTVCVGRFCSHPRAPQTRKIPTRSWPIHFLAISCVRGYLATRGARYFAYACAIINLESSHPIARTSYNARSLVHLSVDCGFSKHSLDNDPVSRWQYPRNDPEISSYLISRKIKGNHAMYMRQHIDITPSASLSISLIPLKCFAPLFPGTLRVPFLVSTCFYQFGPARREDAKLERISFYTRSPRNFFRLFPGEDETL